MGSLTRLPVHSRLAPANLVFLMTWFENSKASVASRATIVIDSSKTLAAGIESSPLSEMSKWRCWKRCTARRPASERRRITCHHRVSRYGGGADSPVSADPDVVSDDERQFAQDVTRRLMMGYSWTGRLPLPNDLRQYDEIVPGAAAKLVDDIVYETRLAEQSITIDKEVSTRVLPIMESQHTFEVEESRSDREFRENVFGSIRYLLYLPLAVILIVVFAPLSDWAKATVILGVLAAYVVPLCIVLLKGRMTEPEKDAISTVVPAVVAAVTSVLRSQSDQEQSPVRKLPPAMDDQDARR